MTASGGADDALSVPGDEGFGVYVHWPFCRAKCPYCDFNSRAVASMDQGLWRAALIADLERQAARLDGTPRVLTSVFFGGGTPSLMAPETVEALVARARQLWPAAPDLEVTLEANPGTVDAAGLAALKAAGVNRLSLGLQALSEAGLKSLGRRHSVSQSLDALAAARVLFERVSVDLMCARPGQSADAWAAEMAEVIALAPDHVSVYSLTVEPGTPLFTRVVQGEAVLPDEEDALEQFLLTRTLLAEAGLPAYEVSNHARPGHVCLHNRGTWRGGEYVGVGPGAHGRLRSPAGPLATVGHADPDRWIAAVHGGGLGWEEETLLSLEERAREIVMTGLRLSEGVSESRLRRLVGLGFEDVLDPAGLALAADEGLVVAEGDRLIVTEAGFVLLNAVTAALIVV